MRVPCRAGRADTNCTIPQTSAAMASGLVRLACDGGAGSLLIMMTFGACRLFTMSGYDLGDTIVTVGVDTHSDVHVAAALDQAGRLLGIASFPVSTRGYAQLATWAESFGTVDEVGMEGTAASAPGSCASSLIYGLEVVEVDRSDRSSRRRNGKSDPLDAKSAARAVLSGRASPARSKATSTASR